MDRRKALVVDNDRTDCARMVTALRELGFDCDEAADGRAAYDKLVARRYDLAVLDIDLPFLSGHDVIVRVRPAQPRLPIIAVSAYGGMKGELAELAADADDYIHKPCDGEILKARVRKLLRLYGLAPEGKTIRCGDIVLHMDNRTVVRGARTVALTALEFNLLAQLARNKGLLVPSADLEAAAWPDRERRIGSCRLHDRMASLRRKLTAGGERDPIRTQWGAGYGIF